MTDTIKIHISTPDGSFKEATVAKIQLPARDGIITILSQRAPSIFALDAGMINILDNDSKAIETFFINSGFADYANGFCKVLVEKVINKKDLKIDDIKEMLSKDDLPFREFYEFIFEELNKEK